MSEEAPRRDPHAATHEVEEEETGFLDVLIVLAKHKKLVLGLPLGAAVVATIASLLLPNIYTAATKIIPPQQGQSSTAALLAQFGTLMGGAGATIPLPFRSPTDLYVAMLKSRTVADNLVARFRLKEIYDEKTMFEARRQLTRNSTITAGKDGIITIEYDDKDPKRAAEVANAYVEELLKLTSTLAISEASQRRLFFENQLKQTREQLTKTEIELRQAIDAKGLAGLDVQSRSILEPSAQLRAQIALREVQLSATRIFATDRHPDIARLRHEISSMKSELGKLEGGDGKSELAPANSAGFENLRRFRDVKFLERLTELLTQQFEAAKIDEAKDMSMVQVLDRAVEPEERSKPKRSLIIGIAAVLAAFLAVIGAVVLEALVKARDDPSRLRQLDLVRQHLRWR